MLLKSMAAGLAGLLLFPALVHSQPLPATVPTPIEPANGATVTSFGPTLRWVNPAGTLQYHLQVVPHAGDGPGIDLIIASSEAGFQIPPPPEWYGLLPDMTYTWRVRTAVADLWGPWVERTFRTPSVSSQGISLSTPEASTTPVLQWSNTRSDVFYYEVELSRDAGFNRDPRTATAAVYSALIHGGITNNSYQAPELDAGTTYYWRVRPRVQGDGRPVSWSRTAIFTTPGAPAPGVSPHEALEQGALKLINDIRGAHGLSILTQARELTYSARLHSQDMAAAGVMSHTGSNGSDPGQRITQAGYVWRVYGEIVAAGYQTPEAVVNAWMNSPAHREVILLPELREFGAGVVTSGTGKTYWTVNFGTR